MCNGNDQPKVFQPTELDWFIVDHFCKEIIGPRHEIERYTDPNEEIEMIIQDKIDREDKI